MAGKADIVERIADSVEGISRKQAAAAYDAVISAVTEALRGGDSAKVPGLGTFSVSERAARKGRNPATGEAIAIKASKSVRFKAGKDLKDAVNAGKRGKKR
jgi:DNA-binding protein HU-beta